VARRGLLPNAIRASSQGLTGSGGPEDNGQRWATMWWPRHGGIAMRRVRVIVVLGVLLGMVRGGCYRVSVMAVLGRGPPLTQ
jgi:hypothetical protein